MKLNVKGDKVLGYVLLGIGVGLIFVSIYLMVSVFTGVTVPPLLFHFSDISFGSPGSSELVQIVSGEDMNRLIGMGLWYILMFFIMWASGKIASLGISLVKEIKVETEISKSKHPNQNS